MPTPAAVTETLSRLRIYPVLEELVACLCRSVDPSGEACFCGLLVGDEIPAEFVGCDDGPVAYVRVVTGFPSTIVSLTPDQQRPQGGLRSWTVAVGILRATPVTMNTPDPDDVKEVGLRLLADSQLSWEAIVCCIGGEKFEDLNFSIAPFVSLPSAGGVAGGEWQVTIEEPW